METRDEAEVLGPVVSAFQNGNCQRAHRALAQRDFLSQGEVKTVRTPRALSAFRILNGRSCFRLWEFPKGESEEQGRGEGKKHGRLIVNSFPRKLSVSRGDRDNVAKPLSPQKLERLPGRLKFCFFESRFLF